jgi:hypothetical protein
MDSRFRGNDAHEGRGSMDPPGHNKGVARFGISDF